MRATDFFDAADVDSTLTATRRRAHGVDREAERAAGANRQEEVWVSVRAWLNRVLADCQVLSALSRKHHRVVRATASPLGAVLAEHAEQQLTLADELAERIHLTGGVAAADPRHIAELTSVPRPPDGEEPVGSVVARLLQAHDIALRRARAGARVLRDRSDHVSADLLEFRVVGVAEAQMRELI